MIYKHIDEWYNWFNALDEKAQDEVVHINCCERILFSANDVLGLNLNEDALKVARAFGGGMKVKSTCGVITGGVMALSKYYYDDDRLEEIVVDYITSFETAYTSLSCEVLTDLYRQEDIKCQPVIKNAGQVLDGIIEKYGKRQ